MLILLLKLNSMAIYTDIIGELATAIDGMTIAGGYNYNYGPADVFDPASRVYPQVFIRFPEEVGREPEEEVVNQYVADSEVEFEVIIDDTESTADEMMDNVVEDFKRLLEADHDTLQTKGLIVADYLDNVREYTHVRERPGKVTITFNLNYRVKRSNPSVT